MVACARLAWMDFRLLEYQKKNRKPNSGAKNLSGEFCLQRLTLVPLHNEAGAESIQGRDQTGPTNVRFPEVSFNRTARQGQHGSGSLALLYLRTKDIGRQIRYLDNPRPEGAESRLN